MYSGSGANDLAPEDSFIKTLATNRKFGEFRQFYNSRTISNVRNGKYFDDCLAIHGIRFKRSVLVSTRAHMTKCAGRGFQNPRSNNEIWRSGTRWISNQSVHLYEISQFFVYAVRVRRD